VDFLQKKSNIFSNYFLKEIDTTLGAKQNLSGDYWNFIKKKLFVFVASGKLVGTHCEIGTKQ
jgi:hypothetical protein